MRFEEGWRAYLLRKVKKSVHIPVITVGQIGLLRWQSRFFETARRTLSLGQNAHRRPRLAGKGQAGQDRGNQKVHQRAISLHGGHGLQ